MHHHTVQINHQPEATNFHFIILTFIYSSTCFGRFPAHHQELNDCSSRLWFSLHIVVTVVLCSWSGRPLTQHDCHHDTKGKPEAATAVIELLMMGGKTPETCWAVNKRQDNKLENCCIWLVIYLNLWFFEAQFATTTPAAMRANWYSSVNIVTRFRASWPRCLQTPSRAKKVFCSSHTPHRLSDPLRHLFKPCQWPVPGAKWPERDADYFFTFSAQFKNAWKYTSIPQ